jgi:SAM-dependent methyltransferase
MVIQELYYDLLRGEVSADELALYSQSVKSKGGYALEVGCGTGRLLLPMLRSGLQVEGVDASADMLAICKNKAEMEKVTPLLYQYQMQDFELPKKYNTIFIEGGSFMLLGNRADALSALKAFYNNLAAGGQVLIELFLPLEEFRKSQSTSWNLNKTAIIPEDNGDNARIYCSSSSSCNFIEQLISSWTKYEIFKKDQLVHSQMVPSQLRWYSKYEFLMMLEKINFVDIEILNPKLRDGTDEDNVMIFKAFRK